jgi:S-formylglutathione hydrolase FrmB
MRRSIAALLVVFVVVLAGIFVWYTTRTRSSEAQANLLEEQSKSSKMIPVQFVVKPPTGTPENQPLFISGSAPTMGNWREDGARLDRQPDGTYAGTIELMSGVEYAFKINRGTWSTVERGPNNAEIDNHTCRAEAGKPCEVAVATWVDNGQTIPGRQTTAGTIVVTKKFPSKLLNNERDIAIYLPPDYDASEEARYPVLYMQDGQNLFNEATSFQGIEWKMDETAQRLVQSKQIQPLIIVGIYNTEWRNAEFTPLGMNTGDPAKNPTPRGDLYGRFIVEELKPFIDRSYRTMPDREHTAVGGSAQGGLITTFIAKQHKDVFGSVALCSPWLRSPDASGKILTGGFAGPWMKQARWYVDYGAKGSGAGYPPNTRHEDASKPEVVQNALTDGQELNRAFDSAGLVKGKDYSYSEVPDGTFNETGWQSRVEPMLMFLFKSPATGAPATGPTAAAAR